jgi:uncharacterized protein YkwD
MRWRQILLAAAFAIGAGYVFYRSEGATLTVALAVALLVYAGVRVLIATFYRSLYWLHRDGRRSRECRGCGRQISRRAGDLVTKCHHTIHQHPHDHKPPGECGWIAGWPGTRLLTRSVFTRQFARSVTWQRLGVIALAAVLLFTPVSITAGTGAGGAAAAAGGTATPVRSATVTETPTETATPYLENSQAIDETTVEQLIFQGVNDRRDERGMAAYSYNGQAAEAAEEHARHMARNNYFSHTEPNGETQEERYAFCDGGENAAKTWVFREVRQEDGTVYYTSADELAAGVVTQWMDSDPHRERGIYGEWWSSAGVGVAITDSGEVYAVMGFCT